MNVDHIFIYVFSSMDIWEPYNRSTYNGFKYFLTIVDDFIRFISTHLMSTKVMIFHVLQSFINMVET